MNNMYLFIDSNDNNTMRASVTKARLLKHD